MQGDHPQRPAVPQIYIWLKLPRRAKNLKGGPAGSLVRLEGDEVGPAVRNRLSVHQIGVADLLEGLRLLDAYPRSLVLLGLVPETLELGLRHSAAVDRQIPLLVEKIVEEAERLGYELLPKGADETAHRSGRDPAARALGL